MILLDTDVLVDCLRGTAPAFAWMEEISQETLCVPGIVAMELVEGTRDKNELLAVRRFLNSYTVVWSESHEFASAFELLAEHRLRTGVHIPDCLVAAMALNRSATLYSFNIKHYRVFRGLDVREPYKRL